MPSEFPSLLRAAEQELLDRWVQRSLVSGAPWASRASEDLRRQAADILHLVLDVLDGRPEIEPRPATGSAPDSAAALAACLAGFQVVQDKLESKLSGAARQRAGFEVLRAFQLAASRLSRGLCDSCMGQQLEQRVRVERQLAALVARGEDGMVLFDGDLVVHGWNPAAERIFGRSAPDAVGRRLPELLGLDEGPDTWCGRVLADLHRGGSARAPDVRWQRPDGAALWLDVSCTSVLGRPNDPGLHWAIFRDVGRSKRMEEEKLQAERLALIGTMSAKLAHEVRNPLNSILLGLDLLRDDLAEGAPRAPAPAEETRSLLASVESEVERIQRVVDDYLRFARLPHVELRRVEFDAFLRRHLELVEPEAARAHVRLEVQLGAPGVRVALDESQLWQAVLNLVRNAIEAMPGGGRLAVSTQVLRGQLLCEVADSGAGMSREARENLFRPFFSTKPTGTGLGLALARQIFAEHGAAVECESEPGQGTRFRLFFPDAAVAERDPAGTGAGSRR